MLRRFIILILSCASLTASRLKRNYLCSLCSSEEYWSEKNDTFTYTSHIDWTIDKAVPDCAKPENEKKNYVCYSECTYAIRLKNAENFAFNQAFRDRLGFTGGDERTFRHEALACGDFYEKYNGHIFDNGKPCSIRVFGDQFNETKELLCRCSSRKCNEKIIQWVHNHAKSLNGTSVIGLSFIDLLFFQQDTLIAELNEKAPVTEENFEKKLLEVGNSMKEMFKKQLGTGKWTDNQMFLIVFIAVVSTLLIVIIGALGNSVLKKREAQAKLERQRHENAKL